MIAVLVASLMLAVPLSASVDSDAVGAHRAHLRAMAVLRDAGMAHGAGGFLEMD